LSTDAIIDFDEYNHSSINVYVEGNLHKTYKVGLVLNNTETGESVELRMGKGAINIYEALMPVMALRNLSVLDKALPYDTGVVVNVDNGEEKPISWRKFSEFCSSSSPSKKMN
jgi:hypothetical protein